MVKIMGHRGTPVLAPENTLRSFRQALAAGVAAVEFDVQLTKDGRLAVIHDATLERTTNGQGLVQDFTLAEIQRLDAGDGETVPALEEVFDLLQGQVQLVVELKQPEAAPALLRFFQAHNAFDRAIVISFWHPVLKTLKEQEPRLKTGVLMVGCPADPRGVARAARADALILQYAYATRHLVATAHSHNLLVYVWNIDDVDTLKPYLSMNLDGIGSNRPEVLIEYLRGEGSYSQALSPHS
jgi:glycerophosphoryl diester phosphodiesterase